MNFDMTGDKEEVREINFVLFVCACDLVTLSRAIILSYFLLQFGKFF
jgi:hypothetical protein